MRRPPSVFLRCQLSGVTRALAAGFLLTGCYSAGDGMSPPDRVYFPVGLALVDDGKYLAVVNSDFDLQYNAGTLAILDVERVRDFVPQPCEEDAQCPSQVCDRPRDAGDTGEHSYLCLGEGGADPCDALGIPPRSAADRLLYPGLCEYVDPVHPPDHGADVQTDYVEIGAFATDALYVPRPPEMGDDRSSLGRVFIPVRGDATVHWVDVNPEGKIDCGQSRAHGACDDEHRAGDDPDQENTRDLRLAPEPFGIAADARGSAVLVTNQTSGKVSVFRHEWTRTQTNNLELEFEVSNLASRPMGVAALPTPGAARALELTAGDKDALDEDKAAPGYQGPPPREYYTPGFLVTFRNAPEVDLIRYFPDDVSTTERPYAARVSATPITINSIGSDSRGIGVDDTKRLERERHCDQEYFGKTGKTQVGPNCKVNDEACSAEEKAYVACLREEAAMSLDVFVASRAPSSLLVGHTTPADRALQSTELPAFYDAVSLTQGPSRVVLGRVKVGADTFERRVFVSCFDSRRVFVYDPDRRRIETEIVTGRGPHALAVDEKNGLLFIGHFTDSFIGVASLDKRFPHTYGKMLATVGEPSAPRASK